MQSKAGFSCFSISWFVLVVIVVLLKEKKTTDKLGNYFARDSWQKSLTDCSVEAGNPGTQWHRVVFEIPKAGELRTLQSVLKVVH